jgi:hypothetical protein
MHRSIHCVSGFPKAWKALAGAAAAVTLLAAGASSAAAQSPAGFPNDPGNGFPPTPVINPVAQTFLGKNWELDRTTKDPLLRGNCGSLPIQAGCATPVDRLEPLFNGRMKAWIQVFHTGGNYDEVMSPKWACTAASIQTGLQEAYLFNFTVNPEALLQKWEQSNWTRTIWMDGRPHPPLIQLFYHGHSIGRVVSPTEFLVHTSNFTFDTDGWDDHSHLPTSHMKQLTERYVLVDKDTMTIEFTVIDPVFLKGPFTWKRQYKRTDTALVDRWDCDPDATYPEVYQTEKPRYADDTEWIKYNPN